MRHSCIGDRAAIAMSLDTDMILEKARFPALTALRLDFFFSRAFCRLFLFLAIIFTFQVRSATAHHGVHKFFNKRDNSFFMTFMLRSSILFSSKNTNCLGRRNTEDTGCLPTIYHMISVAWFWQDTEGFKRHYFCSILIKGLGEAMIYCRYHERPLFHDPFTPETATNNLLRYYP